MTKLEFSLMLNTSSEKLIELAMDYEKFVEYLPEQIINVKILKKIDEYTITEETLLFKTIMKKKIIQRSKHEKIGTNRLVSKIISGPFENSTIDVIYDKVDSGTHVIISAEIKIPLKYKILTLMIKKVYKIWLSSVLYKMNNIASGFS